VANIILPSLLSPVPAWVVEPAGSGKAAGVVVLHDALGMTTDLRRQADWLAENGYLAIAPDLYRGGKPLRCMVRLMRDMIRGREDEPMTAIAAARAWLLAHPRALGKVGVVGFCMGGGFALMLAPRGQYQAAAVNYGGMDTTVEARLASACPIVGSYGSRDPTLRGMASRLDRVLTSHGVEHDVKEYEGVGHGFMNDHVIEEASWTFRTLGRLSRTCFDADATADARRRIIDFFAAHLA
jgi:carboxymethylenebutenolidase